MRARCLALLMLLTALDARALPSDAPVLAPPPEPQWQNYVVPALENVALDLMLVSFSNLVTREPFALISPQTMARNLRLDSWTVDTDYYITNQFGHAYHGAWSFNAARSAGLNFWWAGLYTVMNSLTWELLLESELPSVNDQITTPIAGALLGEVLHRAALRLRSNGSWLGALGATLLDPFGALNGELLGDPWTGDVLFDPLFVRWQAGVAASAVFDRVDEVQRDRSPPQALVSVLLVSGAPWSRQANYDVPLSYFDLRADLAFPTKVVGNIFLRGLLYGGRFGDAGVWGLFGAYDYASAAIVRASAVGLGPGGAAQWQPLSGWYLQAVGLVGASPFGAAGQLLEVSPDAGRDYHVGPGVQTNLDLRLIKPGLFQLELTARNWVVIGAYLPPKGFESITWVTLATTIPIWRWFGAGAEFTLSDRRSRFEDVGAERDTGLSLRLLLSVLSEPHFGISPHH